METISFQEFLMENKDSIRKQLNTIIDQTFKGVEKPLDYKSDIDTLLELKRKPFPTQAQLITASVTHLRDKNSLIVSSEMGTGKTLMGIALSYSLLKSGGNVFIMSPSHLVPKWASEIEATFGKGDEAILSYEIVIIRNFKTIINYQNDSKDGILRFFICSKEVAKLSYPREKLIDTTESIKVKKINSSLWQFCCSQCGKVLEEVCERSFHSEPINYIEVDENGEELKESSFILKDVKDYLRRKEAGFPISNTISAGYLEVVNGNNTRETIIPCSRLGENLQKGLEAQTEKLKQIHMAQLGLSNIDSYDEKMRGLSELFHTSHANSRNILQQVMLVHSYRDGIQNMERMYGLGAGTLATASSVAHYSFFNQNLQQGILAQKFLPLIKAYLTAIIVGLSWIIVILALLLGLNHLRIILSMYIFLIVWTPTLGLINFLNDLFLEFKFNAFQKYTDGMFGFNIAFNTEFFIAMQERASIMGYLVMLTPGLAYMLTKGSDYVISNLASGLTSPIASGARAGALDSTKQAQSTRSDIAIGEDVYSKQAGMREILGTGWSNGMATQQQTKLDELGNPMNSKVSVGYGASLQLSKDGNGNIHYTDGQSGQISKNSIESHTTQQVKSASENLTGAVGKLTKEEISSVINKGLDAGVINEKSIGRSEVAKAMESLVESGEWTKQDIDKIGGYIEGHTGTGFNIKIFKFGASGGIRLDSSSSDIYSEKLGENKTKALENAINKQLAEKALSSEKVSASFTDGQSSGKSASLTEAVEAGKAYSDALQISNSINNNDLSGAIKQKAEQLAMQDGLVLGVSGDMALHQRYATQAFSEMIQEASSFSSLENNIAKTPNSMYNVGASGVNVDNHHKESDAKVRRFNEEATNSLNQKSAEKIAEDYINFGLSKDRISTTIQKGANETGPFNFGPLNNFILGPLNNILKEKGILSDSMNAGKFVDEGLNRFSDYLAGKLNGK